MTKIMSAKSPKGHLGGSATMAKPLGGKKLLLIFPIVALLAAGCGSSQQATNQTPVVQNTAQPSPTATASTTPTASSSYTSVQHVTSTTSSIVGKITVSGNLTNTVSCGSEDCFNKHFSSCTPATLISDAGVSALSYKIIGAAKGGCTMTVAYTKYPMADWVNQPMTCTFDNTTDLQTAYQKIFSETIHGQSDCTGPFVKILVSLKGNQ